MEDDNSLKTKIQYNMGKTIKVLFINILLWFFLLLNGNQTVHLIDDTNNIESYKKLNQNIKELNKQKIIKTGILEFNIFLDSLSMSESSMNPNAFNQLGYIGEFQFGRSALKDINYHHITYIEFKKNPNIFPKTEQRKAITLLIKLNRSRLKRTIKKYKGKIINGALITESGLLGAAHLAGIGGVKMFLRTNGTYDPADINGTKLSDYLIKFGGYNFNLKLIP